MARARTERMLNLLFVLLNSSVPLTREQIRERVPGYSGSEEAVERMFERDKAALRDLAIPVETKPVDLFHDDVVGYRINRKDWLMPEVSLSSQERTYLALAASAWQTAQQRTAAQQAVRRISAQEQESFPVVPISLAKGRKHIPELLAAIAANHTVSFEYVGTADSAAIKRTVDPWRALLHSGHWYLVGFDQDKGEIRIFRTDRIVGEISETKQDVLEPMPKDFDISSLVARWDVIDHGKFTARIELKPGRGASLRLLATEIVVGQDWDTLTIPYFHDSQLVGLIASSCDVTRVLEPKTLHEAVTRVVNTTLSVHNNGK
ncbi:MAG: WYL domain-containing protein [Actinomycetes bacterium]